MTKLLVDKTISPSINVRIACLKTLFEKERNCRE